MISTQGHLLHLNLPLTRSLWGFPHNSVGKESACNAGYPGSIPGLGRSAGEGIGYPLQCSWASLVAQLVKNCLQCGRPGFDPWVGKIPWRRERLPTPEFWPGEFLCGFFVLIWFVFLFLTFVIFYWNIVE